MEFSFLLNEFGLFDLLVALAFLHADSRFSPGLSSHYARKIIHHQRQYGHFLLVDLIALQNLD